jgi:hypothetical protein
MHAHYDHYGMQLGLQLFNLHKNYKFSLYVSIYCGADQKYRRLDW